MDDQETNPYAEAECIDLFEKLFPQGFAGQDVADEIAPEGWNRSPLVSVFHPSVEKLHEEAVRIHRNIREFFGNQKDEPGKPEPTLEEIIASHKDTPIEPRREIAELVGKCLWDIFSDNHEVIDKEGTVVDTGSFRGSGGFLADCLNRQIRRAEYDYIDFYMGTIWLGGRANLNPVYKMIFKRLKNSNLDWVYHFPRLSAVDLRGLREEPKSQDKPDWEGYSPSEAFEKQQEEQEKERPSAELRESLDHAHREAVEAAQEGSPPETVIAYSNVYGHFPRGWPPEIDY